MNLARYAREVGFAWSAGVAFHDKLRLTNATLAFHMSNALRTVRKSTAKKYRVNLIGRPHDLWLRTVGGDIFVFHEIFCAGCYALPVNLAVPKTIVDLGANVGLATLFYASLVPEARFICVEPVPGNIELLRRNVSVLTRSVVVEAAIAENSGIVAFDDKAPTWGGSISSRGRIQVQALSIDDLIDRYVPEGAIDVLKVDIEGAEAKVFSGPMAWLDRVYCIIAELHPPFLFEDFKARVTSRGFETIDGQILPTAVRREPVK